MKLGKSLDRACVRALADGTILPLMHLEELHIHPVKSLRGVSVQTASVDALGLVGDRRFLVVDSDGKFLTQRVLPQMARVSTALDATHLTLSAEGHGGIRVPLKEDAAPVRTVSIWRSEGLQAEDCGATAAAWLSQVLERACGLVRIGPAFNRPVSREGVARAGDLVGFADAFPFLILSEASLASLNARITAAGGKPVPMDRFRANLVVSGCDAFAEDGWARFKIGQIVFRAGGPSVRCIMTTTDQLTGERGREPLATLATFRRNPRDSTQVIFAQNLIHETKGGTLRVGDVLNVI